ncbi:recombinase family protein [Flavobacterium nakdongensis]|uniref:recombinase family protein n=1 Tax=Flavobacterium nakdongensis TaxID=3073563 RepID=UPI0038CD74F7
MKTKNLQLKDFFGATVWSYTRVSTKEQFMNNGSIETQVKRIKNFAKENALHIAEEFDAEYESSKKINTQSTLKELINKLKKTHFSKRPKIILIWSPSRFGRAGAEHIQLFVSLRKEFNVYLYSVSSGHNTFNERAENEFSTQLLYAQKENFNRQDTIIPGLINALNNGKLFGRTPKGYDHYGPRVKKPEFVQAKQEIKVNKEGLIYKEAFRRKIYESYTDKQIIDWLASKGIRMPYQSLANMWRNEFYAGRVCNSLLDDTYIKGDWEPLISKAEFQKLQNIINGTTKIGIQKLSGKIETPLVPKYLICGDCDNTMTAYKNKKKNLFYYKCNCCNKTANAETKSSSIHDGVNPAFLKIIDNLKLDNTLKELFVEQLKSILEHEKDHSIDKKRILTSEINDLRDKMDLMEYRFAINEISKDIFERQNQKLKEQYNQKLVEIENLPTKKSNHDKAIKYFTKIAVNPSKFYESLEYNQKRVFQKLLFPEGLRYSVKNREYLTSKTGALFYLTNSFSINYKSKKKGTYQEKFDKSHAVPWVGIEPTLRRTRV